MDQQQEEERYRRLRIRLDGAADRLVLARAELAMAASCLETIQERLARIAGAFAAGEAELDDIAIRAAVTEFAARPAPAPPGFAAALAAGNGHMVPWTLPNGDVLVFDPGPGADADEVWAGAIAWHQRRAA